MPAWVEWAGQGCSCPAASMHVQHTTCWQPPTHPGTLPPPPHLHPAAAPAVPPAWVHGSAPPPVPPALPASRLPPWVQAPCARPGWVGVHGMYVKDWAPGLQCGAPPTLCMQPSVPPQHSTAPPPHLQVLGHRRVQHQQRVGAQLAQVEQGLEDVGGRRGALPTRQPPRTHQPADLCQRLRGLVAGVRG